MFVPRGNQPFRLFQIVAGVLMVLTLLPLSGLTAMSPGTTFADALRWFVILGGFVLVMEVVIRGRQGFK